MKLLFSIFGSIALVISQGLLQFQSSAISATMPTVIKTQTIPADLPVTSSTPETSIAAAPFIPTETVSDVALPVNVQITPAYAYGNPAGCTNTVSSNLTVDQMLANVQSALGDTYKLAERRQLYIWNGPLGTYMDVTQDPYVYEFTFSV